MRKLLFILSFAFSVIASAQQATLILGSPQYIGVPATEGVVRSLGTNTYTAFPWIDQYRNGELGSIIKESSGHAAAGYILFGKSTGSTSYNYQKIVCEGDTIFASNHGLFIDTTTDRTIVDFQASDAGPIKFIYSDDRGSTWHYASSSYTYPAGYSSAQFGKIVRISSGRLLKFFYCIPLSTSDSSIAGSLKSDDDGLTWTPYTDVARRAPRPVGEDGNTSIINGNGWTSEIYVENISNDTLVAMLRNEELAGGSFTHYFSTNGGASWQRLSGTASIFTKFIDSVVSIDRFPVYIQKTDSLVYILAGVRWSGNYKVAYVTVTPHNLLNNTDYSSVNVLPYNANADSNAASNDFGYTIGAYRKRLMEIVFGIYDSSPTSSGFPRDEMIYQLKINL